jgi:hypothetical protein
MPASAYLMRGSVATCRTWHQPLIVMRASGRTARGRVLRPNGYCPVHATGVRLPAGFRATPLQYVD